MPHLTIEYSANLEHDVDMTGLCGIAAKALRGLGLFPEAGIRVRAYGANHWSIADGGGDYAFLDMRLRIGKGRSDAEKSACVETLYAALESWLEPRLSRPFALSLELAEINYPFAEKRLNTIRDALATKRGENV